MKKLITLLLILTLLSQTVYAKNWVKISAWAYNDVSIFTEQGLIPESFENITDYTRDITRGQFAELLFTTMNSKHSIVDMLYIGYDSVKYGDHIEYLRLMDIMKGMPDGNFYPELPITREDAAVSIYRVMRNFGNFFDSNYADSKIYQELTDKDEISDYAADAVEILYSRNIINGTSEKTFSPKSHITIEQAIIFLNRLHNLWRTPEMTDGYDILSGGEQLVQTYKNGFCEYKNPEEHKYILTYQNVRLEFATDIYSSILCETVNNGNTYIAAITYNNTSDIYDVNGELLFTVPYKIHTLAKDYIYTKTEKTYGLYSYEGKELLKPLYSLYETDVIKQNAFQIPTPEYNAPDETVYYIDKETENLYSIDSNGENLTLISDMKCSELSYFEGILYYSTDSGLYARYADGTEICITDKIAKMCANGNIPVFKDNTFSVEIGYAFPRLDGKLFYIEMTDEDFGKLYSFSITDSKTVVSEFIDENVYAYSVEASNPHVYKNHLYYSTSDEEHRMTLMRISKDHVPENVSGNLDIFSYGFAENELIIKCPQEGIYHSTSIDKISFKPITIDESNIAGDSNDKKYNLIKRMSSLYYITADGIEEFVARFPHTYYHRNNYLYYAERTDDMFLQDLYMLNLDTGEKTYLTTDSINAFVYTEGTDSVIYEALHSQLWRIDGDKVSQIYPNSGLDRYEKAAYFRRVGTDLVKIGEKGSCTLIAENVSYYNWIYVENGSDTISASRNF